MNNPGELGLEIVLDCSKDTNKRMDQTESREQQSRKQPTGVRQASKAHPQGVLPLLLNTGSVTEACRTAMRHDNALEKCTSSKGYRPAQAKQEFTGVSLQARMEERNWTIQRGSQASVGKDRRSFHAHLTFPLRSPSRSV